MLDIIEHLESYTKNHLSGLKTSDVIAAYQKSNTFINIRVVFDEVETFNVSWDGKNVTSYAKGTKISPSSETPFKPSTDKEKFEFLGWSTNGTDIVSFPYEIKEETNFVPLFKSIPLYEINFVVDNEVVKSEIV